MTGPEGMELRQGRLMSNSGRSGCLVQVHHRTPSRAGMAGQADEAELTFGLVSSQSTAGEERLGHLPGAGGAGSGSR